MTFFNRLKALPTRFEVFDFALLKLTMLGIGAIMGAHFYVWVQAHFYWILTAAAVGVFWIVFRILTPKISNHETQTR